MSYRSSAFDPQPQAAPLSRLMFAGFVAFVLISLVVMFAGQLPGKPQPDRLNYNQTYLDYATTAQTQLSTYARLPDGSISMPIERAMALLVEQDRIPVREVVVTP